MSEATSARFPYLVVYVRLKSSSSESLLIEALVDTGFDGDVVIPETTLANASADGYITWRLADASLVAAPYYLGECELPGLGPSFPVIITALGEEAIVGRGLTDRFTLILDHGQRLIIER